MGSAASGATRGQARSVIALYMDENVQGQIVRGLKRRGINVLTAEEDGWAERLDADVLDRAGDLGRIAFSRDQDFLREAVRRQRSSETFVGVIYAHQLRVSIGRCVEDLELLAKTGFPEDFANSVYYLPL
jgi:predicted nuclease of predicted toxin-antitoxin system